MLDSGAPENVVCNLKYLRNVEHVDEINAELANDAEVTSSKIGTVRVRFGNVKLFTCQAFYIPKLKLDLLSCSRLDDCGLTSTIAKGTCELFNRNLKTHLGKIRIKENDGVALRQLVPWTTQHGVNATTMNTNNGDQGMLSNTSELWH